MQQQLPLVSYLPTPSLFPHGCFRMKSHPQASPLQITFLPPHIQAGAARNFVLNTAVGSRNHAFHQWLHVAVVAVDDTNFTLYVDGLLDAANPSTTSVATANLTINAFNGLIDESLHL